MNKWVLINEGYYETTEAMVVHGAGVLVKVKSQPGSIVALQFLPDTKLLEVDGKFILVGDLVDIDDLGLVRFKSDGEGWVGNEG